MRKRDEETGDQEKGGALKKRLKEVTKRQQDRSGFACGLLAFKMKLVEERRRSEDGS